MWRMIITSMLYVVLIEGNPIDPLEGPFWIEDNSFENSNSNFELTRNEDVPSQRSFQRNIYNPDPDDNLALPQFLENKRAITLFTRLNPVSNIGKLKIRSNSKLPYQTKERPKGQQPLRWG